MAPELLDIGYFFATHPNYNSINDDDFDTFHISHNNDNETIYLYLVFCCSGGNIGPEDLLVGKICDDGVSTTG
jgi:hypothetical protein